MAQSEEVRGQETDGYAWSCYKTDMPVGPYIAFVTNPNGCNYRGLFPTIDKGRSWIDQTILEDRKNPRVKWDPQ